MFVKYFILPPVTDRIGGRSHRGCCPGCRWQRQAYRLRLLRAFAIQSGEEVQRAPIPVRLHQHLEGLEEKRHPWSVDHGCDAWISAMWHTRAVVQIPSRELHQARHWHHHHESSAGGKLQGAVALRRLQDNAFHAATRLQKGCYGLITALHSSKREPLLERDNGSLIFSKRIYWLSYDHTSFLFCWIIIRYSTKSTSLV